jgi:hypothetical protein
VARLTAAKRSELESFWRAHLDGWRRSDLNQREYCELHGLPLKRFGNWRAKLKHEEPASAGKLLYRRGGGLLRHPLGAAAVRGSFSEPRLSLVLSARSRWQSAEPFDILQEPARSAPGSFATVAISLSNLPRSQSREACSPTSCT